MKRGSIFITGTDTDVGKTLVTGLLARYFNEKGKKTVTQKWVQTGCLEVSEDIAEHMKLTGKKSGPINGSIRHMAPYVLSYPASPHLAAKIADIKIERSKIIDSYDQLRQNYEIIVIEGSGGVLVPYNGSDFLIDVVKDVCADVILVAENRLGAINHTLLSIEALKNRGLPLRGIIFNNLRPGADRLVLEDNITTISRISGVPVLGEMPYMKNFDGLYSVFRSIGKNVEKGRS